jgi:hypothetical protein
MFNSNNGYSLADIAAATNNNNDGFGFGGDGAWIFLLFILILMGGWNGNNWGNNGGGSGTNYVVSDVQRGFDQAAVTTGINNISSGICNGFSNVQQSLCSGFANVNSNVSNGFAQAEIANNARQMADMQQSFGLQTSLSNQLNNIAMNQQGSDYENRAAVADLKYTVATEACADRTAVNSALRDVTAQGVANTQTLLDTINGGIQAIKDQLCQDKIDAKNEVISNLRQELAMKDLAASQVAQNAFIQQGFSNEVDQLYNRLNNCPVPTTPVYGRTPIFTCNGNGCGCGNGGFVG